MSGFLDRLQSDTGLEDRYRPTKLHRTEGENTVADPELPIPEFVNVEANLASLGFFTPSTKRIRNIRKKTVKLTKVVNGQKEEKRVTIIPTAVHGLPNTADQDKYVALMRIIQEARFKKRAITNPITFNTAELLKLLGKTDAGKNYRHVRQWLERITGTLIISHQAVFLAARREWRTASFHVFERFISRGEQLEDGTTAEQHYVYLSDWQLQNLNRNHSLPIDWDTYTQLRNPIAKALIFPLQVALYATKEKGRFEKRYSELASLLGVSEYSYKSKIQEKLGPSLDELKKQGYLAGWKISKTADGRGHKIIFWHGGKFCRNQEMISTPRNEEILQLGSTPDRESLDQSSEPPERFTLLCKELFRRGVPEGEATEILRSLASDQPIWDQLEYTDLVVAKGTIENPTGFLVAFLKENRPLPPSFVSTRQREFQRAQWEEEQRAREEVLVRYQSFKSRQVERYIREEGLEEQYQSRIETRCASYRRLMGNRPDDELIRMAADAVEDEIAEEMPHLLSEQEFLTLEGHWDFSGRDPFGDESTKTQFSNGGNMYERS